MDAERFDQIARSFTSGTRRGVLGFLSTLPLVGGLAALVGEDEVDAKGRHRRRKKASPRHRLSADKKRKKKKKCKSKAQACAGKCGTVSYTCKKKNGKKRKKTVDCGSCACDPPCDECFVCNETTKICEVDAGQVGDPCGETGQVCQADGACACDGDSCGDCAICQGDGTCSGACGGTGCCDGGACVGGTSDTACGTGGDACESCTLPETCGGGGTAGVCGCTPVNPCGPTSCNTTNNCGQPVNCCAQAGATNPGCEEGQCCERTVSPGSFCSATVPCCQELQPGSRSCNGGACCVNSGFPTAQANQCCSGSYVTPGSLFCA